MDDRSGSRIFRLVQALLVVFAVIVAIPLVVPPVVDALLALGVVAPDSTGLEVVRTVIQYGTFAGVAGVYLLSSGDGDLLAVTVPDRRETLFVLGGIVVLVAGEYALLELFSLFGLRPGQNPAVAPGHEPAYFLAMVAVSLLVVGPAEELVFRGVVQGVLRRAWGAPAAIAIATAVFGFAHLGVTGTLAQQLTYVAIAGLLGGVLGGLYERTRNLTVPALVHGGYNAVVFGVQYLAAVGVLG